MMGANQPLPQMVSKVIRWYQSILMIDTGQKTKKSVLN